jgi:hypothetical protein
MRRIVLHFHLFESMSNFDTVLTEMGHEPRPELTIIDSSGKLPDAVMSERRSDDDTASVTGREMINICTKGT